LLLYAGPLGNPPLLVVSDIARIVIRTNFTNAVTETHEIPLAELLTRCAHDSPPFSDWPESIGEDRKFGEHLSEPFDQRQQPQRLHGD
jgi:hypothetical protein